MSEPNTASPSCRSPTLVKNMISGLSYGALNASYQVIWPFPSTPAAPLPSCSLDFPPTHPGLEGDLPPPSLQGPL